MSITTGFGRVMLPLKVHCNFVVGVDMIMPFQACRSASNVFVRPFVRTVHFDNRSVPQDVIVSECSPIQDEKVITSESLKIEHAPNYNSKILKVAFIGRPNAGKSTLVNQIVGRTVCPISMRAHTTRIKAKAVLNEGDSQLIFLDTPGLVFAEEVKKFKFDHSFLRSGEDAVMEADIIGVVYDAANRFQEGGVLDSSTLRMLLLHRQKKSFLIINKVDAVGKKQSLLEICRKLIGDTKSQKSVVVPEDCIDEVQMMKLLKSTHSWPYFDEVFMISALEGDGVGDVKEYLLQQSYPSPWIFKPSEKVTKRDRSQRNQLAVDFLKAAYLDALPAEIPYQLNLTLLYFEENEELCAAEVAVKPKHDRHASLLFKCLKEVSGHAERNLSSALEKACRLRIKIITKEST